MLVLHPEGTSSGGDGDDGSDSSLSDVHGGGAVNDGGCDSAGASALKMQTIMALSSQLLGKKASIVVQVCEITHLCTTAATKP